MTETAAPVRWHSAEAVAPPEPQPALAALETKTAMLRGLRGVCPACGQGKLFAGFLTVSDSCAQCGEKLGQIRADDAPPYFTIFAVAHVVVPGMLWLEKAYAPDLWIHAAIWLPLTLGLTLAMIRPVKGATIGLMLKLGFGRDTEQS